ncbi:BsuBI/PstI family type II restriction endonuclease [Xanthomonas perforans]
MAKSPWETEVWVADAPSHLIHFNGVRCLVPYPERTSGARRLHSFRLIVKS